MLTRNYYNALGANTFGVSAFTAVNYHGASIEHTTNSTYNGWWRGFSGSYSGNPSNFLKFAKTETNVSDNGVAFGNGTAEPTIDDYALSGDHMTAYEATVVLTKALEDDHASITAQYTITNTGTEDFTISEVGLYAYDHASNASASYKAAVLLERTLLETPVTIPAGGVAQVTYTIRLDFPVA